MISFFLPSDMDLIGSQLKEYKDLLEGKTLVLTGAQGFLGKYVLQAISWLNTHVLESQLKVIALDNFIIGNSNKIQENLPDSSPWLEFISHNVIEPLDFSTTRFHENKIDFIIHAAGIASPYYYRKYPLETLEVALSGTKHMLELAKIHDSRMVFMSSSEIYGNPSENEIPTKESYNGNVAVLGNRACYDESKRVGETLCYIYNGQYRVHTNMIRPFNVYGPGMNEKDYRVLPNFANALKRNKPLKIYGDGEQTRTFCYITDAIVGMFKVMLLGLPAGAYNIGNPTPEVSMIQLAKTIQEVLAQPVLIQQVSYPDSYPSDEPKRRCPDITKAQTQLDFNPNVKLAQGLKRFFSWAMDAYKGVEL